MFRGPWMPLDVPGISVVQYFQKAWTNLKKYQFTSQSFSGGSGRLCSRAYCFALTMLFFAAEPSGGCQYPRVMLADRRQFFETLWIKNKWRQSRSIKNLTISHWIDPDISWPVLNEHLQQDCQGTVDGFMVGSTTPPLQPPHGSDESPQNPLVKDP